MTSKPEWEDPHAGLPRLRLADGKSEPVLLTRPTSYMERWDLISAANVNPHRAYVAALGLCWAALRKALAADRAPYRGDAIEYGGRVADYLLGRGAQYADVLRFGVEAFSLCVTDLVGEREVAAAEDFFGGPVPKT